MDIKISFLKYPWLREIFYIFLFGFLSALLGLVEFQIPGMSGTATDLREIPILIGFIYLRKWWSVIGVILLSTLTMHAEGAFTSYFLMHLPAGIFGWWAYQKIRTYSFDNLQMGLIWCGVTLVYYALILPVYIFSEILLLNNPLPIKESFEAMLSSVRFEVVTTALVSSLYIIQNNIRNQLREHKANLEKIVLERTWELTNANKQLLSLNEELTASNEEVIVLNENLEKIVENRTQKINAQLEQLNKYAHANSHEVRAPLARILGLLILIEQEKNEYAKEDLLIKLNQSAEELDEIVKKMNKLLEDDLNSGVV